MKKVSKAILVGFAVLVALGVALIASLNLYVQSPGSQARIQEELSKLLRLPLKLTNISVSPFGGLRITGITVPNGDANFLEAAAFNAHYQPLALLHSKLVITEMDVESPKIVLAQSADGKWKLPEPEEAAKVSKENPPTAAEKKPAEAEQKKSSFTVIVERFEVKNGSLDLLDKDKKHVAALSDVNVVCTSLNAEHIAGRATIEKFVWADAFTFEKVSSPFDYADGTFNLPDIAASFAGGALSSKFHTHSEKGRSPYKIAIGFDKLDFDRLATQSGAAPGQTAGLLSGQIELLGDTQDADRLDGEGRVDLRNAQFHQLDLFQHIGQILGMRELSDLRVRDGHGEFRVSGTKIFVDKVTLDTADLELSAHGIARTDKHLNLTAQLSAEEAVVQRLGAIGDNFAPAEGGRRAIDFDITGTLDKPKTNLLDKLVGQKINVQLGDLLQGVFGGARKPDDEAKKDDKKQKKKDKDKGGAPSPGTPPAPVLPSAAVSPAATPQPQPATPNP